MSRYISGESFITILICLALGLLDQLKRRLYTTSVSVTQINTDKYTVMVLRSLPNLKRLVPPNTDLVPWGFDEILRYAFARYRTDLPTPHPACVYGDSKVPSSVFRNHMRNNWEHVCQKQVSKAGTSNFIPQILWDPASGKQVINCYGDNGQSRKPDTM